MKIKINGTKIKTNADFHETFAKAAGAPEYYGGNLDALYDVLTEMNGANIILTHVRELREALGEYADMIISTLRDAEEECDGISVTIK